MCEWCDGCAKCPQTGRVVQPVKSHGMGDSIPTTVQSLSVNASSYILHPLLFQYNPQPLFYNPKPLLFHRSSLSPLLCTSSIRCNHNPKPQTPNPEPQTPNLKPQTLTLSHVHPPREHHSAGCGLLLLQVMVWGLGFRV